MLLESLSSTQDEFLSGSQIGGGAGSALQTLAGGARIPDSAIKRARDGREEGDEEDNEDDEAAGELPSSGGKGSKAKAKATVMRHTTGEGKCEDEGEDETLPDEAEAEAGLTPSLARFKVRALAER